MGRKRRYNQNAAGYMLNSEGFLIHRTVCRHAHGPIPESWHVHHVDSNRHNNSPGNLIAIPEWMHARIHALQIKYSERFSRSQILTLLSNAHLPLETCILFPMIERMGIRGFFAAYALDKEDCKVARIRKPFEPKTIRRSGQ